MINLLLGVAFLFPLLTADVPAADIAVAHIVYRSGNTVYLDAGRDQGLVVGQQVTVVRDGVDIAALTVASVSSSRASCTAEAGAALKTGDEVRFAPTMTQTTASAEPPPGPPRRREQNWFRRNGLRGAVDLRVMSLKDRSGYGEAYAQPALNLRLLGANVGGSPYSLAVDVRTRRTYRTRTDGDHETIARDRVYRLMGSWQRADSPWRVSAGRQTSPNLSSVSTFDGALGEYARARWVTGAFVGTQPDAVDYGLSTDILEYGAFGTLSGRPDSPNRYTATAGVVSSRTQGISNRNYLFLRGIATTPRFTGYAFQEIDVNAGWKQDAGENAVSLTSTALSLQYRIRADLDVRAGFDNRRNIRLARDRETPESEFDDAYRLGWSVDGGWRPVSRLQLDLGFRTYGGTSSGDSDAITGRFRLLRLTPWSLELDGRTTRYTGPYVDGWLYSLAASGTVAGKHRVEVHGGLRQEQRGETKDTDASTTWFGGDVDVNLARGWYILLSLDITRGDVEKNDQLYTGVSRRF